MLLFALLLALLAPGASGEVVASLNRGDDARGDGSPALPFRTVTRALAAARASGARLVRLEYGTYEAGEDFPLLLPAGFELRGIGPQGSILRGSAETLVRLEPGPTGTVLAGLSIVAATPGSGVGVELAPAPERPVALDLRGVELSGFDMGMRVVTGEAPARIFATGLRLSDCDTGLDVAGTGVFGLQLEHASVESCRLGLHLHAAETKELSAYAGPPVQHSLELLGVSFLSCAEAGFQRSGAAGTNAGTGYRFADCTFQRNAIGVHLVRPAADAAYSFEGCSFLGNANFGVFASGHAGDPDQTTRIEDCSFRWNGVGLSVTNSHVLWDVRRSQFLDNVGNALFLANFQTAPLRARVESTLVAGNGGAGIYTMADGERFAAEVLHCTIVDNGAAGLQRKTRHFGKSTLEVRGSILAGNAPDLEKVEPAEVFRSLVEDGSAGTENGNLSGDPGFVDARRRDFRLAGGSAGVDAGEADARLSPLDCLGTPRSGAPDLGACERAP